MHKRNVPKQLRGGKGGMESQYEQKKESSRGDGTKARLLAQWERPLGCGKTRKKSSATHNLENRERQ